jgi:hypothetical protein
MDILPDGGEAQVRMLAAVAGLPLAVGREKLLAPTLSAWLAGANELNRMMSAPEHRAVTPIVVFTHPRH